VPLAPAKGTFFIARQPNARFRFVPELSIKLLLLKNLFWRVSQEAVP
jgi:hypothetical protein